MFISHSNHIFQPTPVQEHVIKAEMTRVSEHCSVGFGHELDAHLWVCQTHHSKFLQWDFDGACDTRWTLEVQAFRRKQKARV